MIIKRKNKLIIILFIIISSLIFYPMHSLGYKINDKKYKTINYNDLINTGINQNNNVKDLINWFNSNDKIDFSINIKGSITIKFIDGTYKIILNNPFTLHKTKFNLEKKIIYPLDNFIQKDNIGYSAQLLNPSEYLYGNLHIKKIFDILIRSDYNIEYISNQDVDLDYIKNSLNAKIIYINTHAGFWDIDGDQQGDCVVIGTGEYWTDETEILYKFEYENKMIVEGIIGDQSFICFTPSFITYYYNYTDLPSSLIYMATCHASYDDSMANAFLNSGASAYMGWTQNTVFWTNSISSVKSIRLLNIGLTVKQTCNLIRYGGFVNILFRSKLTYFGDGNYKIP